MTIIERMVALRAKTERLTPFYPSEWLWIFGTRAWDAYVLELMPNLRATTNVARRSEFDGVETRHDVFVSSDSVYLLRRAAQCQKCGRELFVERASCPFCDGLPIVARIG